MGTSELVETLPSAARPPAVELSQSRENVASLFDLHAAGLYRLALAMLHDSDAAQDVVQEAFLRLLAHIQSGGALPNAAAGCTPSRRTRAAIASDESAVGFRGSQSATRAARLNHRISATDP